jgi:hypothetical protein
MSQEQVVIKQKDGFLKIFCLQGTILREIFPSRIKRSTDMMAPVVDAIQKTLSSKWFLPVGSESSNPNIVETGILTDSQWNATYERPIIDAQLISKEGKLFWRVGSRRHGTEVTLGDGDFDLASAIRLPINLSKTFLERVLRQADVISEEGPSNPDVIVPQGHANHQGSTPNPAIITLNLGVGPNGSTPSLGNSCRISTARPMINWFSPTHNEMLVQEPDCRVDGHERLGATDNGTRKVRGEPVDSSIDSYPIPKRVKEVLMPPVANRDVRKVPVDLEYKTTIQRLRSTNQGMIGGSPPLIPVPVSSLSNTPGVLDNALNEGYRRLKGQPRGEGPYSVIAALRQIRRDLEEEESAGLSHVRPNPNVQKFAQTLQEIRAGLEKGGNISREEAERASCLVTPQTNETPSVRFNDTGKFLSQKQPTFDPLLLRAARRAKIGELVHIPYEQAITLAQTNTSDLLTFKDFLNPDSIFYHFEHLPRRPMNLTVRGLESWKDQGNWFLSLLFFQQNKCFRFSDKMKKIWGSRPFTNEIGAATNIETKANIEAEEREGHWVSTVIMMAVVAIEGDEGCPFNPVYRSCVELNRKRDVERLLCSYRPSDMKRFRDCVLDQKYFL